jgi:hypothetical protein
MKRRKLPSRFGSFVVDLRSALFFLNKNQKMLF